MGPVRVLPGVVIGLAVLSGLASRPSAFPRTVAPQTSVDSAMWIAILAAEDGRAPTVEDVATLERAATHADTAVRRLAVRALGRLERPALVGVIVPILDDSNAAVRAEAANALGQAVFNDAGDSLVHALTIRLDVEHEGFVRGALLRTLGRLSFADSGLYERVEAVLRANAEAGHVDQVLGAAMGYESLVRRTRRFFTVPAGGIDVLATLAEYRNDQAPERAARIRKLAIGTALSSGGAGDVFVAKAMADEDPEIRRLGVTHVSSLPLDSQGQVLARALADSSALVRYAALQRLGQGPGSWCVRIAQSANDSDEHVRLLAIDLLSGCGDLDGIEDLVLARLQLPTTRMAWHEPAHALLTLAQLDMTQARAVLPAFAAHEVSWVRVYAARAAARLTDWSTLSLLAGDQNDNVRQAAISGLSDVAGHDADSLYVAQLSRADYQLIMTAAQALEGSAVQESTLPLLLIALRRISLEERETSRDPRMALLDRIGEFGSVQHAKALEPYLTDFDPVIARRAAEVMGGWTAGDHRVRPRGPPEQALPSLREIRRLAGMHPVLVMRGGGEIVLRLFPDEAPTNVARFARLANAGYFDGLTFHRVVPGFVIQGGSPGANEYMGDGPYTRDELGLRSHVRGTVGISTRGRDTGDAQIFVNLVDNVRLDHDYTIIAEVIDGMTTVDGVLEGGVIERVEWRDTP